MEPSSNAEQDIVFPNDTLLIIKKIQEKYGLEETSQKFWDRFKQGEATIGGTIAKILRKAAKKELSFEEFVFALRQELKMKKETAEKLANDLEQEILVNTQIVPVEETESIEEEKVAPARRLAGESESKLEITPKETLKEPAQKSSKTDRYREPIE